MNDPIHQTVEEIAALNAKRTAESITETNQKLDGLKQSIDDMHTTSKDKTVSATGFIGVIQRLEENNQSVNELKDYIDHPEVVVRKLEEVKSASLVSNKLLKDISKKEFPKPEKFPKEIEVSIKGISTVTLKGDKGDKGEKGDKGDFVKGDTGEQGVQGKVGPRGSKGDRGDQGEKGNDAKDGADGKDGSPDSGEEIIDKINEAEGKIDPKRIKGLTNALKAVDDYGKFPSGGGGGGTQQLIIQDEGTRVSDFVTALNFVGAGVQLTYGNNGTVTVTVSGSAGTEANNETPSGTINGSNTVFTLAHTPSPAASLKLYLNGAFQTAGGEDYTLATATITFINAPLTGGVLRCFYTY